MGDPFVESVVCEARGYRDPATVRATWGQSRMWRALTRIGPPSEVPLSVVFEVDVVPGTSRSRCVEAIVRLVEKYESLRTRFALDPELLQVVERKATFPVDIWSATDAQSVADLGSAAVGHYHTVQFDHLSATPPIRFGVLESGRSVRKVIVCASHLLLDGWSQLIVQDTLAKLVAGVPEEKLADRCVEGRERAAWERSEEGQMVSKSAREWRQEAFSACPRFLSPHDLDYAPGPRFVIGNMVAPSAFGTLQEAVSGLAVSVPSMLLACYARVMAREAGVDRMIIMVETANRLDLSTRGSVLQLSQDAPVLIDLKHHRSWGEFVRHMHLQALRAYRHGAYSETDHCVTDAVKSDRIDAVAFNVLAEELNSAANGSSSAEDDRRFEVAGSRDREFLAAFGIVSPAQAGFWLMLDQVVFPADRLEPIIEGVIESWSLDASAAV